MKIDDMEEVLMVETYYEQMKLETMTKDPSEAVSLKIISMVLYLLCTGNGLYNLLPFRQVHACFAGVLQFETVPHNNVP